MDSERKILSEVAKLYYENDQTQAEIASRFGISRPKVSRMLAEARARGIVKIFIDSGEDGMSEMERRLFSAFNLKGVRVASVPEDDQELAVQLTAQLGAQYLSTFLNPGDRIGVGWGWTLCEMTRSFPTLSLPESLIVQLTGSVDNAKSRSYAGEIVGNLSRKVGAKAAYTLPCPAMVDSAIIFDILRHDAKLRSMLELGSACNKLFVNIALPDEGSCLYQAGYLGDKDLAMLAERNAVGSICCRFFDERGEVCDQELDGRTVGIHIDEIRKAECVMACISGYKKARAVYCALRANLLDVLVIDSLTAARVLELVEAEKKQS